MLVCFCYVDIVQLATVFKDFLRAVHTKDKAKAENALQCLSSKTTKEKNKDIDDLNEEIQLIDEIRKELKISE